MRSRPIIVAQAILTGLGILFGATALSDVFGETGATIATLGALLVLAAKGVVDFYVNATTTPSAQVVATQQHKGADVVAGPASSFTTGAAVEPHLSVGQIAT